MTGGTSPCTRGDLPGDSVRSHKDIEKIVNSWEGFSLYSGFRDENGTCDSNPANGTQNRKSLDEPHYASGQIYRTLVAKGTGNGIGLVDPEGKVRLRVTVRSMELSPGRCFYDSVVLAYVKAKENLFRDGVKYTPDYKFEASVLDSAKAILESPRVL